ncbi:MAG TPA: NYN domain-containing protein [Ktedonobacteraceae bacterium]|nr:NYN domain-containing protein [Ktedonobacteraceae bacterium]
MGREILVDGYNVIKNGASFRSIEVRNLAAAREALITQMVSKFRHTPHKITIVFDGDGNSEQTLHDRRICIIYSKRGETADSVIARLTTELRMANREVEMYSDDGEVRYAVMSQGGTAHQTVQLITHLNAPSKDVAARHHHRARMKRRLGIDPNYDPDAEPEYPHPKKKSSHKRR